MAAVAESPKRESTPTTSLASIPQKRVLDDDHVPAVSSPLNPDTRPAQRHTQLQEDASDIAREKRKKKDSLKKRESKGAATGGDSSRATPDPKAAAVAPPNEASPLRYKLKLPIQSDFEPSRPPVFTPHHQVPAPSDDSSIEFYETSEHVYNKKGFQYTHCIADPAFPSSFYYRHTEPEPPEAHMSFEDAATHLFFDRSGRHITTDKGYRLARANVAVREGRWYWECKITRGALPRPQTGSSPAHGHVRMGFARREASLDAPVGFDAYSYGFRDVQGQKVHMSRPKEFFPEGEDMLEGDVVGLEIQLPSEGLHRKVVHGQYNPAVDLEGEGDGDGDGNGEGEGLAAEAPNIVRDRIPIRFKQHIYFERIDYQPTKELEELMNPSPMSSGSGAGSDKPNPIHPVPAMRTLPNSHIKIYKNGKLMGTAFTDLLAFLPPASKPTSQLGARGIDDGMPGYYPAVSVFRGGAAEVNFGPKFWYPPPGLEGSDGDGDVEMTDGAGGSSQKVMKVRALSDRYEEQIVEDIVYDIVDEVDFWMQDGGRVIDRGARDEKAGAAGIAPVREEIKELVQDD